MVKDGVVIIDVGITRVKDLNKKKGYVLKGDVDFDSVIIADFGERLKSVIGIIYESCRHCRWHF